MHVTVEPLSSRQYQRKGLFGTKTVTEEGNFLRIAIELTADEESTIDKQQLWASVLCEVPNYYYRDQLELYQLNLADYKRDISRPYKLDLIRMTAKEPTEPTKTIPVRIADLCNPDGVTLRFGTSLEVKNRIEEFRNNTLPLFKGVIDGNKSPPQKMIFDL
jgi:hypothetical protein